MKRRGLITLSLLAMFALGQSGWTAAYSDLEDPALQAAAVVLAKRQVMRSLSPSEWGASNSITRIELAEIIDNLLDPRDIPFQVMLLSDVPPGHRAAKSVNRVVCFGIMQAEGGNFNLNNRISRLELVKSLDKLLTYRSILPPPRRKSVVFPDAKRGNPAFPGVERAANHWQLIDNPEFIRFRPYEAVTRGEALPIILKAACLIERDFEADYAQLLPVATPTIEPTEAPTPAPSTPKNPDPAPTSEAPPEWLISPTPAPTETPTPGPSLAPIVHPQRSTVALAPVCLLIAADTLSSSSQSGTGVLSTLYLSGLTHAGSVGIQGDLNTTIIPGSLDSSKKATAYSNGSYSNMMAHLAGLFPLPWKVPDGEVAGGFGTYLRLSMADAAGFYLGLGPSGSFLYRQNALTCTSKLGIYPLVFGSGLGFGLNPSIEVDYQLLPLAFGQFNVHAGLNEQLDIGYSGGCGSFTAIFLGASLGF